VTAAPTPFVVLLRHPDLAVAACFTGVGRRELTRTALLSLLIGGALFGGVIGSFRGDLQVLYAAFKLPLVFLGALVVTAPALWACGATDDRPWPLRTATSLVLVGAGRSALVLASLTPLLWLAIDLYAGYHLSAVLAAATLGLSGLAGLGVVMRGLAGMARGTLVLSSLVFFLGLAQFGWTLRPWLVRPGSDEIVLVRTERGVGVFGSVAQSARHGFDDPSGDSLEGDSW
jgi:hypothetical protein